MTNNISEMRSAVKKVAWGFLLIYIHFNLGTIDILPDWAGYALMVSALSVIALEEESAKLIKPFGTFLVVWNVIEWLLKIFGMQTYLSYLSLIPAAINLYFTFQLFTNLAGIADKYSCPQGKRILTVRTINVIFSVSNTFLIYLGIITEGNNEVLSMLTIAILVISLIIMLTILATLFSFAHSLSEKEEEILLTSQTSETLDSNPGYIPLPKEDKEQ